MSDIKETTKEKNKDELLKSFHEQFAQNQNHHQTVFIQFISAVFVVIVGYGFVYTNTLCDADFYYVTKDDSNNIVSYAIIHLMGSFFIAELILILLCILILNIGYGFRRDQNVNYKIRKHYLSDTDYDNFFGKNSFNPQNKGLISFLPGFNLIFVIFILILQIFLIFSLIVALRHFDNFSLNIWDRWLLLLGIITPLVISILMLFIYYKKYSKTVDSK